MSESAGKPADLHSSAFGEEIAALGESAAALEVHRTGPVSFTRTEDGGVEFDEHKMEPRRPYPFQVDGVWFVAVRRSRTAGDVRLYNLDQ